MQIMMTPTQRKAEFDRLFLTIPGTNIERIRRVCAVLFVRENTVRQWRMAEPPRVIPERSLQILARALQAG